ncbi:MAG TPA: cobalamin-binding protein [Thermoplasmata archaeon]
MSSQKTSASARMIWIVVVAVVVAAASFATGFYVGSITQDDQTGFVVVDDYGRTVQLNTIPERIVSVAPTPTEILFAIGAGSQVVGVDDYSDYPSEAASLPKVGAFPLNKEAVLALDPDLIVSSDLVPLAQLEQLSDEGIPYVIFADRTIEGVFKTVKLAGIVTGHVEEADQLVSDLEDRVEAVTNQTLAAGVDKPKVYVEYYPMWTYGPGSFGDDLIALAGGVNIAANASSEYPEVTNEFVIAQNPDVIVYTTGPMSTTTAEAIASRTGWSSMTAVSEDAIYSVDDNLLSRYGPRIVEGLEALAEILHPELFP